ncbi:hypothetical protein [Haloechinothrix halophila]|uniref:hypothetical protein n=1 Tax=Haloechinothrix halophila TaxID=1069073 RepID=UPI00041EE70D|nr:hypothetical protein [Haloechinothrix halophila]
MHRETKTDTRLAVLLAAFASIGAGAIHVAVVPNHWQEWPLSGVFFAGLAAFQLGWAAVIIRWPRPTILGIGLVANLGAMILWAVSRVWGVPFGPHAGVPEAVGAPGVLTMVLEASILLGVTWSLLPRHRSALLTTGGYRFAVTGAALAMLMFMASGVITGLEHTHSGAEGHHGPNESSQHDGDPPKQSPKPEPSRPNQPAEPTQQAPTPTTQPPAEGSSDHDDGDDHSHG